MVVPEWLGDELVNLCPKCWWVIVFLIRSSVKNALAAKRLPTYHQLIRCAGSPMRRLPEEAEEDDAAGVIVGLDMGGNLMLMNHCGWCQDFPKRWTMIIPNQNEVKPHPFHLKKQPCGR